MITDKEECKAHEKAYEESMLLVYNLTRQLRDVEVPKLKVTASNLRHGWYRQFENRRKNK